MMAPLSLWDTEGINSCFGGEVPEAWKKPNAVPIHKKDKQDKPCNYSPDNLVFILCKAIK